MRKYFFFFVLFFFLTPLYGAEHLIPEESTLYIANHSTTYITTELGTYQNLDSYFNIQQYKEITVTNSTSSQTYTVIDPHTLLNFTFLNTTTLPHATSMQTALPYIQSRSASTVLPYNLTYTVTVNKSMTFSLLTSQLHNASISIEQLKEHDTSYNYYSIDTTQIHHTDMLINSTHEGCFEWDTHGCTTPWQSLEEAPITTSSFIIRIPEVYMAFLHHNDSFKTDITSRIRNQDNIFTTNVVNKSVELFFDSPLTKKNSITLDYQLTANTSLHLYANNMLLGIYHLPANSNTSTLFFNTLSSPSSRFSLQFTGNGILNIDRIKDPLVTDNKPVGTFGIASDITTTWQQVSFAYPLTQIPIVIHTTSYESFNYEGGNGGAPDFVCLSRITNVTTTGFAVKIEDWDDRAGFDDTCPAAGTTGIDVHYVAVIPGVHTLSDNSTTIEAARVSRFGEGSCGHRSDWDHAENNYNYNNSFTTTPYVFASVQTYNDPDEINTYIKTCGTSQNTEYDNTCAQVGLNGLEPTSGLVCDVHTSPEDVGILVWGIDGTLTTTPQNGASSNSTASWSWSGVRSNDVIRGANQDQFPMSEYPVTYDTSFGSSITSIAAPIRIDGNDGFVPVQQTDTSNDQIFLIAMEDENNDDEQGHTPEIMKILVFNDTQGVIFSNDSSDTLDPILLNTSAIIINNDSVLLDIIYDEPVNISITYTGSPSGTVFQSTFLSRHGISITNLLSSAFYTYSITACDTSNNCVTDGTFNFTTSTTPDTTSPLLLNESIIPSLLTASINTTFNEPVNLTMFYNSTTTQLSSSFTNISSQHSFILSNLLPNTTYTYQFLACDTAGNCLLTPPANFTTLFSSTLIALPQFPTNNSLIYTQDLPVNITYLLVGNSSFDACVRIFGTKDTDPLLIDLFMNNVI